MATIPGTNGNDTLTGTSEDDSINGGNGADTLDGAEGDDTLSGGNGEDTLAGGEGDDTLAGGNGDDVLDGGAGDDAVDGDRGDDVLVYVASENADSEDFYDGAQGQDTLHLVLTASQWGDATVRDEIDAYRAFLASHAPGAVFQFESFALQAVNFEHLTIEVVPDPVNYAPTDIALDGGDAGAVVEGKAGAVVGVLSVLDPNLADTHTFTVSDERFTIEGNTLRLKDGIALDFEPGSASFVVEVTATDSGGLSRTETFTIEVKSVLTGAAIDGYISGATVFADTNENGIFDEELGEVSTVTDENGNFTLVGGSGPLVMTGGTDIWTGLAFDGVMRAPDGSTVITPLTTLVAAIAGPGADPADVAAANALVLSAFGLDSSLNLSALDPIALALSEDAGQAALGAEALAAAIQVQATIGQATALLIGADAEADLDIATATEAVIAALAAEVESTAGIIDLSNTVTIGAVLNAAAAADDVQVDIAPVVEGATAIIAAANEEVADAADLTGTDLITELAQISDIALGTAATALADGAAAITAFQSQYVNPDGSLDDTEVETNATVGPNLVGANGDDTLTGTESEDTLNGYGGNDTINALAGNDVLIGGPGDDALNGGTGDDTYLFGGTNGAGQDTVADISGLADTLRFASFGPAMVAHRSGDDLLLNYGSSGGQVTVLSQFDSDAAEYLAFPSAGSTPEWTPLFTYKIGTPGATPDQPLFLVGSDGVNEAITGSAFGDFLFGGNGDDTLIGGDGDDVLYGGVGADILNGGAQNAFTWGADFVNYADSSVAVTINLASAGPQTGGDAQGDTLIGIEGVIGSEHDDILTGSNNVGLFAVTERFLGGAGNDTINGMGGFDFALYHTSPGAVTVNLGANYTVDFGGGSQFFVGFTALDGFKDIDGFDYIDSLTSIEGARGGSYDDILIGSDRTDTTEQFRGGGGHDIIDGRGGNDMVDYLTSGAGITVDLTNTETVAGGYAFDGNLTGFVDTLFRIENIRASMFDDVLIGSFRNNSFQGLAGDDEIHGGVGFDTADYTLDSFAQGFGGVVVNLSAAAVDLSTLGIPGVTGTIAAQTAYDGFGDTDTLDSIENALGTPVDDILIGNADSNFFQGLGGDDYIDGGAGTSDTASYANDASFGGPAGVTVDLTNVQTTGIFVIDGFGDTDTLLRIENIVGTNAADTITGDGLANNLNGNGGDDILRGLAGNDVLIGGAGIDNADYSRDSLAGGVAGIVVNLRNVAVDLSTFGIAGVTGTIAALTAVDGFGNTDTLNGIENVRGTAVVDIFVGNAENNRFSGFEGDDILIGGDGSDVAEYSRDAFAGGAAAAVVNLSGVTVDLSTLGIGATGTIAAQRAYDGFGDTDILISIEGARGTSLDDIFIGNAARNEFFGLEGDDYIDGGAGTDDMANYGVDSLFGGTAGVTVDLTNAQTTGGYAIDGFGDTDVLFNIESIFGTEAADTITGDDLANGLNGAGGNDTIYGAGGIDFLDGGAGDDVLDGGDGDDFLRGGTGADTLNGGDGDSDMVQYQTATTGLVVDLETPGLNTGDALGDTYDSVESILGSLFDDTLSGDGLRNFITGNSGDDEIFGRGGDDLLSGDAGADALDGGEGNDAAYYGAATSFVTASLATPWINTGEAQDDTYFSIEGLVGSEFNDFLYGNELDNHLAGAGGNDTLVGGEGVDVLNGGAGNDIFVFDGLGHVTVNDFTVGQDRIDLSQFGVTFAALDTNSNGVLENNEGNGVLTIFVDGANTNIANALGQPGDIMHIAGHIDLHESDFMF